jgi:bacillopeptidase F
MRPPVSSRRAQVQERKAKRQLFWSIMAALVLGIIFVFFLMPLLFSFVVSIARRGQPVQETGDVIPPQRPVLQPPAQFQNQKALVLTGFTEAGAQAQLYLDNSQSNVAAANESGEFSFTLELEEGEHELWVSAADEAGNISSESQHYSVAVDLTAPTLELTQPEDGAVFTLPRERTQTVKGKVSEKAQVRVNGALTQTDAEGNFSAMIQLAEGRNEIAVTATDQAGNSSEEKKIAVEYRP